MITICCKFQYTMPPLHRSSHPQSPSLCKSIQKYSLGVSFLDVTIYWILILIQYLSIVYLPMQDQIETVSQYCLSCYYAFLLLHFLHVVSFGSVGYFVEDIIHYSINYFLYMLKNSNLSIK